MKSLLTKIAPWSLGLLLPCAGGREAVAQVPLGVVAAELPFAGKMVADPVRPRMYVLDPAQNRVVSVDTATLTVVGSLPTGAGPTDLAITPAGDLLYVSTADPGEAVDLIGLEDFVEYNSFALARGVSHIAAGVGNRIFVSSFYFDNVIDQLDGSTGERQASYPRPPLSATYFDEMKTTPDGKTLVVSALGTTSRASANALERFNVSKPAAVKTKDRTYLGGYFDISHDGKRVGVGALPNGSTPNPAYADTFSIKDFTQSLGFYRLPSVAGPLVFSGDDQVIYQTLSTGVFGSAYDPGAPMVYGNVVYLYDVNTVELLDTLPLPPVAEGSTNSRSRAVAVDQTGSYLFVGQTGTAPDGTVVSRTLIIGTGRGSGLPVDLANVAPRTQKPSVTAGSGGFASFTVTRDGDLSRPLDISYRVGGSAENGVDYRMLPGTKTIAAGEASAVIRVFPAEDIGPASKTVRLFIKPLPTYKQPLPGYSMITIRPSH